MVYQARKADCGACALKARCTKAEKRAVHRLINEAALNRVALRLAADKTLMNKRAQAVEPAFDLKRLGNLHGTAKLRQALA